MALAFPGPAGRSARTLIGADPGWFVRYILRHQGGDAPHFADAGLADYLACAASPGAVHAWCEDYRAGWGIDRALDEADRGRRLQMPLLVLWGERGSLAGKDGVALWRPWAECVEGAALPCGHYLPEEEPALVIQHVRHFFG